jgi:hypothetical protein
MDVISPLDCDYIHAEGWYVCNHNPSVLHTCDSNAAHTHMCRQIYMLNHLLTISATDKDQLLQLCKHFETAIRDLTKVACCKLFTVLLRIGKVCWLCCQQICAGVPRIFVDSNQSEVPDFAALVESQKGSSNLDAVVQYINQSRINVNIRQVH